MKRMITGSLLWLLSVTSGFTAGERTLSGGRAMAMGGTSVAAGEFWSPGNNQAGAAWIKSVCAGISFENKFLLKELMQEQIGFALPVKAGTFGLLVNRFGNDQYNELKAGLIYARQFGGHFSAGIQLDYLRIHVMDGYGTKSLVSCEIGLLYNTGKHLSIGVQLLNPVPVKITMNPPELLPVVICIGISYRFSDDFLLAGEAEKDLDNPAILRTGAEYHFASPAYARIGFSTNPATFTFGFGLKFGRLKLDMASGYHQALGFSPTGSLTYSFK